MPLRGDDLRLTALERAFGALQVPVRTPGEGDPGKPDRPDAFAISSAQADVLLARLSGLSTAVEVNQAPAEWDAVDTFLAKALTADLAFLAANFRWLSFLIAEELRWARRDLDAAAAALEDAGGLPDEGAESAS